MSLGQPPIDSQKRIPDSPAGYPLGDPYLPSDKFSPDFFVQKENLPYPIPLENKEKIPLLWQNFPLDRGPCSDNNTSTELEEAEKVLEELFDGTVRAGSKNSEDESIQTTVNRLTGTFVEMLRVFPQEVSIEALKEMNEYLNSDSGVSLEEKIAALLIALDKIAQKDPKIETKYEESVAFFEQCPELAEVRQQLNPFELLAVTRYWAVYLFWNSGLRDHLEYFNEDQ